MYLNGWVNASLAADGLCLLEQVVVGLDVGNSFDDGVIVVVEGELDLQVANL